MAGFAALSMLPARHSGTRYCFTSVHLVTDSRTGLQDSLIQGNPIEVVMDARLMPVGMGRIVLASSPADCDVRAYRATPVTTLALTPLDAQDFVFQALDVLRKASTPGRDPGKSRCTCCTRICS